MTDLNELVGEEVLFDYDELDESIPCKIISASLETYYFFHKWNEPMYVRVTLSPLDDDVIEKYEMDSSDFETSLDCLRYYNNKN